MGLIADLIIIHRIRKALRDGDITMDILKNLFSLGALKSKTVWLGVAQIVYPAVEAWLTGAPFNFTTVVTGVLTILARAMTDQSLATK